jgi:hypothetical protein
MLDLGSRQGRAVGGAAVGIALFCGGSLKHLGSMGPFVRVRREVVDVLIGDADEPELFEVGIVEAL